MLRSYLYLFTVFILQWRRLNVLLQLKQRRLITKQCGQPPSFVHNSFLKTCTKIVQQVEKAGSFAIPMKFVGCLTELNNTNKYFLHQIVVTSRTFSGIWGKQNAACD